MRKSRFRKRITSLSRKANNHHEMRIIDNHYDPKSRP